MDIVDRSTMFDASTNDYEIIATKTFQKEIQVVNKNKFDYCKNFIL